MALTQKALAEIVTTSRPTTGTVIDASGNIATVAADTARIDYSDGHAALLVEEARTNVVTRSSHTDAFPWSDGSTANGITATIAGTGFEGAVPYVDYALSGTATSTTANPFANTSYGIVAAAVGEVWTASVYTKLISGVWPNGIFQGGVFELGAGNAYLRGSGGGEVPGAAQRHVVTRTLTGPDLVNVRSSVQMAGMVPGVTTFSGQVIRIWGWQLEKGGNATSLIQTLGGTTVTRAADDCTVNISALGLGSAFTIGWKGIAYYEPGRSNRLLQLDDGSNSNRLYLNISSGGNIETAGYVADVAIMGGNSASFVVGAPAAAAFRFSATEHRAVFSGALQASKPVSPTFVPPTVMRIGKSPTTSVMVPRMRVKSILAYPAALTDAALTALGTV
jgi:hypothetical protein